MEQNNLIAHYASVVGTYQTVGTVFPAVQEASKAAKEAITGVFAECIEADTPLSAASEDGGESADESQGEREQTPRCTVRSGAGAAHQQTQGGLDHSTHRYSNTTPLTSAKIFSNFGRLSPGWAETEVAIGPHPLGCRGREKGFDGEAQGGSRGGEGGN